MPLLAATQALKTLNITNISEPTILSLLDIMDVQDNDDGGGDYDIGFREFARVMTAADLFKMRALAERPKRGATIVDEQELVSARAPLATRRVAVCKVARRPWIARVGGCVRVLGQTLLLLPAVWSLQIEHEHEGLRVACNDCCVVCVCARARARARAMCL